MIYQRRRLREEDEVTAHQLSYRLCARIAVATIRFGAVSSFSARSRCFIMTIEGQIDYA